MKQKIAKKFLFEGLGFPVLLTNVPMIKVRGDYVPNINYNTLQKTVLLCLCHKNSPLTGYEVAFILKYFALTAKEFGKILGCSHVAVLKWEKQKNQPARITPTTEVCIRLFILDNLKQKASAFKALFRELNLANLADHLKKAKSSSELISINASQELAAA